MTGYRYVGVTSGVTNAVVSRPPVSSRRSERGTMNKLTFNRMVSYWNKSHSVAVRMRTKGSKVSEFKPTIDPLPREIASWQKSLDDAAYFQVGEHDWVSREQFELELDHEGI